MSESRRREKRVLSPERTSDKHGSSHHTNRESRRESDHRRSNIPLNSIDSKPSSAASSKDNAALSASSSTLSNSAQLVKDEKNVGNFVEMNKIDDRKHDDPEDKRSSPSSIAELQEKEKPAASIRSKEFSIEVAPGQRIVRRKP